MANPPGTIWSRDAHTGVKHQILRGYLNAWFPIILRQFHSATFFDGFAGPGVYTKGEPGSPTIAINALLKRGDGLVMEEHPARFVFVEDRLDRVKELQRQVPAQCGTLPSHVSVAYEHGRIDKVGLDSLTRAGAWGKPIFANLDPFGPAVPYTLVARLGSNKASEVLVTFMQQFLVRFASVEDIEGGDEMFGNRAWRQVEKQPSSAKEQFLVEEYRQTLKRAGLKYSTGFKLIDEGGHAFWLIYGTGHTKGIEKMKESMWDADPMQGFRFRDPKDPEADTLFASTDWLPDIGSLERLLEDKFRASSNRVSVERIREWVNLETVYRKPHATTALTNLVKKGFLGRDPDKGRLTDAAVVWRKQ